MRVSLNKYDPAYTPDAQYDIYLDGEAVRHDVTADEEAGEVLCAASDKKGNILADDDEIVHEVRYGKVRIIARLASPDRKSATVSNS